VTDVVCDLTTTLVVQLEQSVQCVCLYFRTVTFGLSDF